MAKVTWRNWKYLERRLLRRWKCRRARAASTECTCTCVHVYLSARVLALVERRHGLDEQSAVPPDTDVTRVLEVHQPAVLGPDDHWVHGF